MTGHPRVKIRAPFSHTGKRIGGQGMSALEGQESPVDGVELLSTTWKSANLGLCGLQEAPLGWAVKAALDSGASVIMR